jgi:hypothetical protein
LICFIYFFQLGFKCIEPIFSYCAYFSITHLSVRYFYIICIAYLGNVLKTCSNLTHILFSFERYIKISSNKGRCLKLVEFIKSRRKRSFLVLLLSSVLINLVNLCRFQYDLNLNFLIFPVPNELFFNSKFIFSYFNIGYI